jgi:acyl-coenzyme A thioesterase PaaI-like protein
MTITHPGQHTHLAIDKALVGTITSLGEGFAVGTLTATKAMAADDRGLVHGSFAFGLADYAAMVSVNDPHVVLGSAELRFLAPVTVGQTMTARAEVVEEKGKKRVVEVSVKVDDTEVLAGTLTGFVLAQHVLG